MGKCEIGSSRVEAAPRIAAKCNTYTTGRGGARRCEWLLGIGLLAAANAAYSSEAEAPAKPDAEAIVLADAAAKGASEKLDKVVVVRSRNRLEPLQDVPLSISVVTGQELEKLVRRTDRTERLLVTDPLGIDQRFMQVEQDAANFG